MKATVISIIGGFFCACGVLGHCRGNFSFGTFYMLLFDCVSIVRDIHKYRLILDEENTFSTSLDYQCDLVDQKISCVGANVRRIAQFNRKVPLRSADDLAALSMQGSS